jgi:hypothetical protein
MRTVGNAQKAKKKKKKEKKYPRTAAAQDFPCPAK